MKEIIMGYFLAFLITLISAIIYNALGFKDLSLFVNHYLVYILLVYYLLTIIYHYKKNKRLEQTLPKSNYFPLIELGVSIATIYNMIIFKLNPPTFTNLTPLPLLILSTGIIGPIFEEILFRYLFYNKLKEKHSTKVSILINSIVFALVHLTPISMIYAFILGVVLCVSYERRKTILSPILIHVSANIIVIFLQGYNPLILLLSLINLILSIVILKQRK